MDREEPSKGNEIHVSEPTVETSSGEVAEFLTTECGKIDAIAQDVLNQAEQLATHTHELVVASEDITRDAMQEVDEALLKFREGLRTLSTEYVTRMIQAGFDVTSDDSIRKIIETAATSHEGSRQAAMLAGYEVSEDTKIGKGGSKEAYLLPDGRVLKIQDIQYFIGEIAVGADEVSFARRIYDRLGGDSARRLVADTEYAGPGIPAYIQERVFQTSKAMQAAQKAGDTELATLLKDAHRANPLCRHLLFEAKDRNTGLALRDGKLYVVAFDTAAGDGEEDDLSYLKSQMQERGDMRDPWDVIREDAEHIIAFDPERVSHIPEIKAWLDTM